MRSLIVIVLILFGIGIFISAYTIDETEQGIILEFGRPVGSSITEPGLHFKFPWRQLVKLEKRILEYDVEAREILSLDKRRIVVDNYARWKISDPLQFYKSVRTINGGLNRIDPIIYSELRVELGKHNLTEIVDNRREAIMEIVTNEARKKLNEYGIDLVDVRIKRADLSVENEKAVYDRMIAERERQAKQFRSEGEEEALKIRAETDKDKAIILANAFKISQEISGEGDAKALEIYASGYKSDPEFYNFTRTLDSYKKIIDNESKLILTTDSDFLKLLKEK
ncbi:MAG: protease modulator HflC [Candidatus Marinimicrobia bacterium]|nr:protease modulator HflC [Candidatus Neomarinimicrobiota bacterium]